MLPANQRIRANQDFRRVYARGRSYANECLVVYVLRKAQDASASPRFGFVVSKKQGKAVVRNRIKRRLREAIRLRLDGIDGAGCDVVIVGRGRAQAAPWPQLQASVDDLLRKSGLLSKTAEPAAS
jgi:ribonuclease P protein component